MNSTVDFSVSNRSRSTRSRAMLLAVFCIGVATLAASAIAQGSSGVQGEVAATDSPSFIGMFFVSRSAGPDGILRTEWFGTILIWILLMLSVVGIGLAVNLATANSRRTILPSDQVEKIRKLLGRGAWKEAMVLNRNEHSDFGLMMQASFEEAPHGHPAMTSRVEQVAMETATERFRSIEPLNVLGQVAPMIGLFGTVYGMIVAFQSIVASGGSADPVALAGGIGTALVTTFWGLLVAIPALAAYAFIRNRVDAISSEAESTAIELLQRFKSTPGKPDGAGSSPAEHSK
jgi:biopolymer transport protein ExbB